MIGTVRASFTIIVLLLVTLPLIPIQIILNGLKLPSRRKLPSLWHRFAARIIGLKVTVQGEISDKRPLLIVANHISWLDIVALSASGPVCFIAKQEVSSWPAFGLLAKLQRTVFVNRERRSATGEKTNEIADRLNDGDVMVLFAEGTSTSGAHVLTFRSALIGAAQRAIRDDETVWIQPVALAYTHLQGMAAISTERALTGFYGDMEMGPHLLGVLKEAAIDVSVVYGKPYQVGAATNRKELTKKLETDVRTMKTTALRGTKKS
ncbi:MAG: 1-acyl-sn-glycerol-3-phosphate acyltransferase [Hyphomicrobiales bacterium]